MNRTLLRQSTRDKLARTNDGITAFEIPGKENMRMLPNGSLLCQNVPIARIGWMIYGKDELPLDSGDDGVIYVERTADVLFNDQTIGSFKNAAVVDEHPPDMEDVTPENWKELSRGFSTSNVRRGTGDDSDVLLADLIITDKELIEAVLAGKREVSAGYDSDYEQISPGVGRQHNILGNHIALVDKGRCGPRCAIGDHEYQPNRRKEAEMPNTTKGGTQTRVPLQAQVIAARRKLRDAEAELEELVNGDDPKTTDEAKPGEKDIHIHIHGGSGEGGKAPGMGSPSTDADPDPDEDEARQLTKDDEYEQRFASLEQGHQALATGLEEIKQMIAGLGGANKTGDADPDEDDNAEDDKLTGDADPDEEGDPKMKAPIKTSDSKGKMVKGTRDSAALETSYKSVLAQAEVLVPGFRMPTFDAAMPRVKTIDRMCNARRSCLTAFYATKTGANVVNSVTGKQDLELADLGCAEVATIFKAASGAQALLNNAGQTRDSGAMADPNAGDQKSTAPVSVAQLNELNRKYWEGQALKA